MPPKKRKAKSQSPEMPERPNPPVITRPPLKSAAFTHFIRDYRKSKKTATTAETTAEKSAKKSARNSAKNSAETSFTKIGEDGLSQWREMSEEAKAPYFKAAEDEYKAFNAYKNGPVAKADKTSYDEYEKRIEVYWGELEKYDKSAKKRRKP